MNFIKLNPLSPLLPLHFKMKNKDNLYYKSLLREYFENLHRLKGLEDLMEIYSYIENSIEFMIDWWEEIISRE